MLLESLILTPDALYDATGWEIKPEGACRGDECVPLTGIDTAPDGTLDVGQFADRMQMPLATDDAHGLYALGPRAAGSVLESATVPEVVLDDFDGNSFDLATLRGRKVLLVAWASW